MKCLVKADEAMRHLKMGGGRKKLLKKHLSPSRRRALCPFFLQSRVVVQTLAPRKAAAGSVGCLVVSLCERNCKELLRTCTTHCGWQKRIAILRGPVCKGEASKNRREYEFSFSAQVGKWQGVQSALYGNGSTLSPVVRELGRYQLAAGSFTLAPAINSLTSAAFNSRRCSALTCECRRSVSSLASL